MTERDTGFLCGLAVGLLFAVLVGLMVWHTENQERTFSLMHDNGMGGVNRVDYGLTFLDCFERMMPHGTGVTCEIERP